MPHITIKAHFYLNRVYLSLHQTDLAYQHLSAYIRIKDSVTGSSVLNNLQQLDIKYCTAQKEKELAEQQLVINRQSEDIVRKNAWLAVILSGCILLVAAAMILYRSYRHKQRRQAAQIHTMQQEQEISNLKSMIQGEEKERALLPDYSGSELVNIIRQKYPEVSIVIRTSLGTLAMAQSMMQYGCMGYLLKDTDRQTLIRAIEQAYNKEEFIEPSLKKHDLPGESLYLQYRSGKKVPEASKVILTEKVTGQGKHLFL